MPHQRKALPAIGATLAKQRCKAVTGSSPSARASQLSAVRSAVLATSREVATKPMREMEAPTLTLSRA